MLGDAHEHGSYALLHGSHILNCAARGVFAKAHVEVGIGLAGSGFFLGIQGPILFGQNAAAVEDDYA